MPHCTHQQPASSWQFWTKQTRMPSFTSSQHMSPSLCFYLFPFSNSLSRHHVPSSHPYGFLELCQFCPRHSQCHPGHLLESSVWVCQETPCLAGVFLSWSWLHYHGNRSIITECPRTSINRHRTAWHRQEKSGTMGTRYMICRWAINRSDPQNLLSVTLDVPLQFCAFLSFLNYFLSVLLGLRCSCWVTGLPTTNPAAIFLFLWLISVTQDLTLSFST